MTKISIIMPVYNGEAQLSKTIEAIRSQTLSEFEVILVDDGSSDRSCEIIREVMVADTRFTLLQQSHSGAGAARNLGLSAAKGEYVIFSDCDDWYLPHGLEALYQAATHNVADIAACNFSGIDARGNAHLQLGIQAGLLPAKRPVFCWRDCPNDILRVAGPMVWNKLYRREFLLEKGLEFDQLFSCNDLTFVALSLAQAERITCTPEHLIRYPFPRLSNPRNPGDVAAALKSVMGQLEELSYKDTIQNAILRFGIDHFINALKKYVTDFSAPESEKLYRDAHEVFNREAYFRMDPLMLGNGNLYREFCTVQKHSYETMRSLTARRIIVSLTSYPKRIGTISQVLDSVFAQRRKADKVILWLAEEQFPGKEAELPEELTRLVKEGRLTIGWCEDLKPHKKYFYAFREYPEDLVITVDDDLLYSSNTISALYASYLLYPEAVSAVRTHMMVFSDETHPVPYGHWIHETDICIHTPSMQLVATGGAGALYPPHLLRKEFLDPDAIRENCLWADDLWLKAMQLMSDVPVVLARPFEQLHYLPGSQDDALFSINIRQGQNDVQLENIIRWTDAKFGPGAFLKKITGAEFLNMEEVSRLAERERRIIRNHMVRARNDLMDTRAGLEQSQADNARLEKALKHAEDRLERTESHLAQTQQRLEKNIVCLNETEQKLRKSEESKPVGRQLKALGDALAAQRKDTFSPGLALKYLIYCFAWIPEKILEFMMCCLRNGFKYTFRKLFKGG